MWFGQSARCTGRLGTHGVIAASRGGQREYLLICSSRRVEVGCDFTVGNRYHMQSVHLFCLISLQDDEEADFVHGNDVKISELFYRNFTKDIIINIGRRFRRQQYGPSSSCR